MAGDIVTRLTTVGLPQYLSDFNKAQGAENQLLTTSESVGVRLRQVYDSNAKAAEEAARRQEEAAKRVEENARRAVESLTIISGGRGRSFEERQAGIQAAVDRGAAQPELDKQLALQRQLQQQLDATAAKARALARVEAEAAAQTVQAINALVTKRQQDAQAAAQQAKATREAAIALDQQRRSADAIIRQQTQIGNLQAQRRGNVDRVGFAGDQAFARQNPQMTAQFARFEEEQGKLGRRTRDTNRALDEQVQIFGSSSAKGITYLSTLSAIHSASFLLGNQTFTNVGSLTVLGAAFSKLGPAASVAGVGFGAALLGINTFVTAAQQTEQVINGLITGMVGLGAAATTLFVSLGVQGVRAAADVEKPLALLAGLSNAAVPQLVLTEEAARDLGIEFGISAAKVTEAASLFVRAGGSIEAANEGATRAILTLQLASGGELAVAEAARTAAVAMAQFSEQGVTAARVANVITATAQRSAIGFTEVSQAFQQATPSGVQLGFTIEELGATIAVLGNRLRGTVAGTSFKQFLLDLVNPSDKAKEALNSVGLSSNFMFDAFGNARPVIDIITDLSNALEGVSQEDKIRALAQIFESRAGLAGNILSLKNIREEYLKTLDAMSQTSAAEVAARVLNTVNQQAGRVAVTIEELGRSFGGPLLGPVKEGAQALVDFFKNLIEPARLAGEIVGVVLGGQGFGQLQQRIQDVTGDPALSTFLTRLTGLGLQLRDALLNDLVPAAAEFARSLLGIANEAGRVEDINDLFDKLSSRAAQLTAGATLLIGKLAGVAQEFVNNEGTGGRLRGVLETLANAVKNNLIVNLVRLAPVILTGIVAFIELSKVGRALLETFIVVGPAVGKIIQGIGQTLDDFGRIVGSFFEDVLLAGRAGALVTKLIHGQLRLDEIDDLADLKDDILEKLTRQVPAAPGKGIIQQIGDAVGESAQLAGLLLGQFDSIEAGGIDAINTVKGLVGEIPNLFANLAEELAEAQERADIGAPRTGGTTGAPGGGTVIDPKKIEEARNKVLELSSDLSTKLANVNQDTTERTQAIIQNGLDKMDDIFEKANEQLDDLARNTKRRLDDLDENLTIRRAERSLTDTFTAQLEQQTRATERFFEDVDTMSARNLETRRLQRQRDTEDEQRRLNEQVDANERANKRVVESQERAFAAAQQAQDRALQQRQDNETKTLQRSLENQATARSNARELAEAKTPQDRAEIVRRQQLAQQDTAFQRGQQAQLDALRKRQDAEQLRQRQQQEAAQVAFRRQIEAAELQQRRLNEANLLRFRRRQEDAERVVRQQEENSELQRRRTNEETLRVFREGQESQLQAFRDDLEDKALLRQKARIREEAATRRAEILEQATTQADRAEREVGQQLEQQQLQTLRTLRNEQQRIIDRIDDIQRTIPGIPLAEISQLLDHTQGLIDKEIAAGDARLTGALDQVRARRAELQPATVVQQTPVQALLAGARISAQIILPGNYVELSARAFELALRRYNAAQGEGGGDINIQGDVVDQGDFFNRMAEFGFNAIRGRR